MALNGEETGQIEKITSILSCLPKSQRSILRCITSSLVHVSFVSWRIYRQSMSEAWTAWLREPCRRAWRIIRHTVYSICSMPLHPLPGLQEVLSLIHSDFSEAFLQKRTGAEGFSGCRRYRRTLSAFCWNMATGWQEFRPEEKRWIMILKNRTILLLTQASLWKRRGQIHSFFTDAVIPLSNFCV